MSRMSNQSSSRNTSSVSRRIRAKFYIFDLSNLINISRELAEKYVIRLDDMEKLCEQNLCTAFKSKRYDIVKVMPIWVGKFGFFELSTLNGVQIWDLMRFITLNDQSQVKMPLDPDHGRPWSCSVFGRPLVNNL